MSIFSSFRYQHENLLRPIVESRACAVSLVGAFALGIIPNAILTSPIRSVAVCLLLANASRRGYQAYKLHRFHRAMSRTPYFAVASDDLISDPNFFYVGRGYTWGKSCVERLYQYNNLGDKERAAFSEHAIDRWVKRLSQFKFFKQWLDQPVWTLKVGSKQDSKKQLKINFNNPFVPALPVGGQSALHGVGMFDDEKDIWLPQDERGGHMAVLGTTGVGKTRFLEVLVTQDIRRGNNVVLVIDAKGDAGVLRRLYAESQRAGREFYVFHLAAPKLSARYNPISDVERMTEVATRLANQLPSTGNSAAFRQFVWRYVNVINRAMTALGKKIRFIDMYNAATSIDSLIFEYFEYLLKKQEELYPNWREEYKKTLLSSDSLDNKALKSRSMDTVKIWQYCESKGIRDDISVALAAVMQNEKSYFDKLVASLFPVLEKLTTGDIKDLLSPEYASSEDVRPIITWDKIIQQKAVVYIGLDALTDREVSTMVGNMMLGDLTSTAGKIYNRGQNEGQAGQFDEKINICLHVDEFNELIGDEFTPLLNKARGAGFMVTVYTQTWDDVEAKMGDRAKAAQMLGNINTKIFFRIQNIDTAKILTDSLKKVEISRLSPISASSAVGDPAAFEDFGAANADKYELREVPMLQAADLLALPKGQAFVLQAGGNLFKVRLPMPSPEKDQYLPDNLEQLAKFMEQRYLLWQTKQG